MGALLLLTDVKAGKGIQEEGAAYVESPVVTGNTQGAAKSSAVWLGGTAGCCGKGRSRAVHLQPD